MNIDNGTSDDLRDGLEVLIKAQVEITEVGGNYIVVEDFDGEEYTIRDASWWTIEILD